MAVTYGNDKIKDIAEGILPATRNAARAARKARRQIHKKGRARSREEVLAGGDGRLAATLERHEIVDQMWRRRGADNLSALFRWAERTTRHISDPEVVTSRSRPSCPPTSSAAMPSRTSPASTGSANRGTTSAAGTSRRTRPGVPLAWGKSIASSLWD
jgi:hypothetical protein